MDLLTRRTQQCPGLPAEHPLNGTVHNRLGHILVQEAQIPLTASLSQLTALDLTAVAAAVKDFCALTLTGPMGMDCARSLPADSAPGSLTPLPWKPPLPRAIRLRRASGHRRRLRRLQSQWAWVPVAGTAAGKGQP